MNIVDLFAGCGGMSLGFRLAGFDVIAANEIDEWAAETYTFNHPETSLFRGDIRSISDWNTILPAASIPRINGVVGGPPCQGFSLSGNRDSKDPRNSLFMDFVRCVEHFAPDFFVMENVRGILSMTTAAGVKVADVILSEFSRIGYKTSYALLNAADYGVPQLRERVFFVGLKDSYPLCSRALFPSVLLEPSKRVTVEMAISDLPQIEAGGGSEFQEYDKEPQNEYQRWARMGSTGIYNHVGMRHSNRLIERFKVIGHGQSVAHVPDEHSALKRGNPKVKSGKVFGQNNMRVYGNLPSPTVAASFQSNFVHPNLNRNFTAREGARLQSFPDVYRFCGRRTTMSWEKNLSQYQQIGNAVPPLLARAIALNLIKYLGNLDKFDDDVRLPASEQLELV